MHVVSLHILELIKKIMMMLFDKFNETNSHVIGSLIKKIHVAKNNNKKTVEIWGNGKSKREFIYVDDVAYAIKSFLFTKKLIIKKLFWVNIGSGIDYSITSIAKKIAKEFNYTGEFIYNTKKPNGAKSKLLDIKLSKLLGFKPKVKFDEGIKKTVSWYLKNYTSN